MPQEAVAYNMSPNVPIGIYMRIVQRVLNDTLWS
jgi:hypothetical protein